jgi:hypothetical protein
LDGPLNANVQKRHQNHLICHNLISMSNYPCLDGTYGHKRTYTTDMFVK